MGRVALVIGGNRGIGEALVRLLADTWKGEGHICFTVRRAEAGAALEAELRDAGHDVEARVFDLAAPEDPARLAAVLADRFGGLDLVVQNGAYAPSVDRPAREDARPMIEANNLGTHRVLRAFAPFMRPDGRLVIIASGFGVLSSLPETLRDRFDTRAADPDAIDDAMRAYVEAAETDRLEAEDWPAWVNIPSKVGQVAVTRAFARKSRSRLAPGVLVNAACPGVTLTDATRPFMGTVFKESDAQTTEEAAAGLMKLLTVPAGADAPYGELVQHGRVLPYGD